MSAAAVALDELRRRRKDQLLRLIEVSDLTKQLDQAVSRKDEVSVQLLLSMRQAPIEQLDEIEKGIEAYLHRMPEEDAIRCKQLLDGAEPRTEEEDGLYEQNAQYRRTLTSVLAADRALSLRMGGKKSIYRLMER